MNAHANTGKLFKFFCALGVLSVMVVFALPAEAQAACSRCKSCGEGVSYSKPWALPGGLGNLCDAPCGECSGTCGEFCESEVNLRLDTERRLLLAKQLGPNQIRVHRSIGGREFIRGIVSLDLPPAGTTAEAFADLRVAMSPSVCKEARPVTAVTEEGS